MQGPTGVKLSSATKQFIEGGREAKMVQMRLLFEKQADLKQERFEIELMMEDLNKYTSNRKKYLRDK